MAGTKVAEKWRAIPGFDGAYEASDHGRIRSKTRKWTKKWPGGYHVLSPANDRGSQRVCLSGGQARRVHRLVLLAFVGKPRRGDEAEHLNGIRTDNRPSNLRWCSHRENVLAMVKRCGGRPWMRAEHNPRTKLTPKQVRIIRHAKRQAVRLFGTRRFGAGELARVFGVTRFCVYCAASGRHRPYEAP